MEQRAPAEEADRKDLLLRLERCVFYFDLDNASYLPKLTKYVTLAGAVPFEDGAPQCSAFLDKNVTHLVTDKAATIAENYSRSRKWGFSILPLEEFATIMLKHLDAKQSAGNTKLTRVSSRTAAARTVGPGAAAGAVVSPTLHRYASASRKRDLSQYLEDERKKTAGAGGCPGGRTKTAATSAAGQGRGLTSLVHIAAGAAIPSNNPNANTNTNANANANNQQTAVANAAVVPSPQLINQASEQMRDREGKKPYFRAFEHPFLLIQDVDLLNVPIWKEYGPEAAKSSKSGEPWPVFYWECPLGYCPFLLPPSYQAIKAGGGGHGKGGGGGLCAMPTAPNHPGQQSTAKRRVGQQSARVTAVAADPTTVTCSLANGITTRAKATPPLPGVPAAAMAAAATATALPSKLPVSLRASRTAVNSNLMTVATTVAAPQPSQGAPDRDQPGQQPRPPGGTTTATAAAVTKKRPTNLNINRTRPGYCECCYERYSDLEKHIRSLFHRQFALEDKNYVELDGLLDKLTRDQLFADPPDPIQSAIDRMKRQQDGKPAGQSTVEGTGLLRSPVSQKSSSSVSNPSTVVAQASMAAEAAGEDPVVSSRRNYTASKRAKQLQALKEFRPVDLPCLPTGEDKENCTVAGLAASAVIVGAAGANPAAAQMAPSSPSLKRRRSSRQSTRLPVP